MVVGYNLGFACGLVDYPQGKTDKAATDKADHNPGLDTVCDLGPELGHDWVEVECVHSLDLDDLEVALEWVLGNPGEGVQPLLY